MTVKISNCKKAIGSMLCRSRRCGSANSRGFTLLEILLTLVILTVGISAISGAFSTGMFVSADIENTGLALNIARANIEEVRVTPFKDLSDSGPDSDPDFPDFNVKIDVAEGDDPMPVDVTVSWDVKGETVEVSLTTFVTDM